MSCDENTKREVIEAVPNSGKKEKTNNKKVVVVECDDGKYSGVNYEFDSDGDLIIVSETEYLEDGNNKIISAKCVHDKSAYCNFRCHLMSVRFNPLTCDDCGVFDITLCSGREIKDISQYLLDEDEYDL